MGREKLNKEKPHPLVRVWAGILARCYTESATSFDRYGAVGVRVCDDWRYNFKSFYNWCLANGWEKGLQIDKDIIPKKLGIPAVLYSPETCTIITPKENSNNRTSSRFITYKGEKKTLKQWADSLGMIDKTLMWRLKRMSVEEAFTRCIDRGSIKNPIRCTTTMQDFESINDAARKLNITPHSIYPVLSGKKTSTKNLHFEYLN